MSMRSPPSGRTKPLSASSTRRACPNSALAINEAVYGPEHPDIAITLTNLGIVHSSSASSRRHAAA